MSEQQKGDSQAFNQGEKKGGRSRPTANQVTTARRRRRKETDGDMRGKLGIDTTKLDPNYQYRWAEASPERMAALTKQDDYDIVENVDKSHGSTDDGTAIRRPSGEYGMLLLRKPKKFYEEDQKAKKAELDELDKQIKEGGKTAEKMDNAKAQYKADGGISIRRAKEP